MVMIVLLCINILSSNSETAIFVVIITAVDTLLLYSMSCANIQFHIIIMLMLIIYL